MPGELNQLSRQVIGACIAVHKALGAGLSEDVYANAFALELDARGVTFEREHRVEVRYRDKLIGFCKIDFLVDRKLVVELKSADDVSRQHVAQTITYLRLVHQPLGLIVNFNVPLLKDGIKRVILGQDF